MKPSRWIDVNTHTYTHTHTHTHTRARASAVHVILVLSFLRNSNTLAADFKQVIIPDSYFLPCYLTRHWFLSCQQRMWHWFCVLCIFDVFDAKFQPFNISTSLFCFFIVPGTACELDIDLFNASSTCALELSNSCIITVQLQYNSCSMAAKFEQATVSIRLFFRMGIVYLSGQVTDT